MWVFPQDPILAMYSLMFIGMIAGISQKMENVKREFHENVMEVSAKGEKVLFDLPFVIPCLIADPIILVMNSRERACSSFSTQLDILACYGQRNRASCAAFCSLTRSISESDYPECVHMKVTARGSHLYPTCYVLNLLLLFSTLHDALLKA
jgi:hypothetical protein